MSKDSNKQEIIDPVAQFRRRLRIVIVLSLITIGLATIIMFQSSFRNNLAPTASGDILWLYTLSVINFLAFAVFFMVLGRNVLKLMRERASNQVGARFKTQLVLFSIAISLLPLIFLFFSTYGLINRSIDKWFSAPARKTVDNANEVQEEYRTQSSDLLYLKAKEVALRLNQYDEEWGSDTWISNLTTWTATSKPAYIEVFSNSQFYNTPRSNLASFGPEVAAVLSEAENEARAGRSERKSFSNQNKDRFFDVAWVCEDGTSVVLVSEIPRDVASKLADISTYRDRYTDLSAQSKSIRTMTILILASITLLLLFGALLFALYMARGITEPITELVKATDQVAHGNLDYRVRSQAKGELALLVSSFNQMSEELLANRAQLEKSTSELQTINLQLEERRGYIETILQSLSTGVITVDNGERLTTINDRAVSLLQLEARPAIETPLSDFLGADNYLAVAKLIRQARRMGNITREVTLERRDGSTLPTATSITPLKGADRKYQGTVIMIEDLTELIKAQRSAAWSEVARRMAHEIKNPLTPIQLSAERIARKFRRNTGDLSLSQVEPVISEGTETIIREVGTLKRMVDEFSKFARLPKAKPAPTSLNTVVENAIALYKDRTNGIRISEALDPEIPELSLDADQFKQVLVNLIDNAIEAIHDNGDTAGQIEVQTRHQLSEGKARLVISDSGHGVAPEDRDKLFLPYFSTKKRDTGLGLAIVNHIVAEHGGRIFVEDNHPRGARFVVELPT